MKKERLREEREVEVEGRLGQLLSTSTWDTWPKSIVSAYPIPSLRPRAPAGR